MGTGHGAKRKAGDSRSRAPTDPKASVGSCHWIHWTADPWGPGSQPESRHPSRQAPGPAPAPGRWRAPGSRWEPERVQEAGRQLGRQPGTPSGRVRTEAPPGGQQARSLTPRPVPAPQRPEGRRPVCIQSRFILCRSLMAVMDTSWFFSPNSSRWAKRGMYRQGSAQTRASAHAGPAASPHAHPGPPSPDPPPQAPQDPLPRA